MRNVLIAVAGVLILAGAIALSVLAPEVRERPAGSVERREVAGGTEVSSRLYTLFVPKPWTVAIPKEGRMDSEGGVSDGGLAGLFYVDVEAGGIDEDTPRRILERLGPVVANPADMSCERKGKALRCRPAAQKPGTEFAAAAVETGGYTVTYHGFSYRFGKDVHAMADNLKVREVP